MKKKQKHTKKIEKKWCNAGQRRRSSHTVSMYLHKIMIFVKAQKRQETMTDSMAVEALPVVYYRHPIGNRNVLKCYKIRYQVKQICEHGIILKYNVHVLDYHYSLLKLAYTYDSDKKRRKHSLEWTSS